LRAKHFVLAGKALILRGPRICAWGCFRRFYFGAGRLAEKGRGQARVLLAIASFPDASVGGQA
jgi:hypothetical protein